MVRFGDVTDPSSLARDGFRGEPFDVLVSCLASRTGSPDDAWAIDFQAHVDALEASKAAGVTQFILLSAICVQKPVLAFQHAKLAFEEVLAASGLDYTIVRPTAFFKSLSGQLDRLRRGKPFLVFGDGMLTACKPISDDDLGNYLAGCDLRPIRGLAGCHRDPPAGRGRSRRRRGYHGVAVIAGVRARQLAEAESLVRRRRSLSTTKTPSQGSEPWTAWPTRSAARPQRGSSAR